MDENVETLAVEHQPRDDAPELRGAEDDLELRHRVRADLLAAEPAELDREFASERLAQFLRDRKSLGIVIDMRVIAVNRWRCVAHERPPMSCRIVAGPGGGDNTLAAVRQGANELRALRDARARQPDQNFARR